MRKTVIISILLALALSVAVSAQEKGLTQIAPGVLLERGGKTSFAIFAGGNPFTFYSDTVKGFYWYNRDGYFYSPSLGGDTMDVQAAVAWVLCTKEFTFPNSKIDWEITLGGGLLHQFKNESDITTTGFKLETGATIWKSLQFAVGCDYFPRQNQGDVAFVYGLIALHP